jgi:hypothetical protein
MGISALAALVFTGGNVTTLVIMYSINVFVTFSLSMLGMCRYWWAHRPRNAPAPPRHVPSSRSRLGMWWHSLAERWRAALRVRRLALFGVGATLCLLILGVTVYEKFGEGGWVTLALTGVCIGLAMLTNRYYRRVFEKTRRLDEMLVELPTVGNPNMAEPDASQPTAAILVGGFGGLGTHTLQNSLRAVPGYFKNIVFIRWA